MRKTKKQNNKIEFPIITKLGEKESLPSEWEQLITPEFSKSKSLFEYQKNALKNIMKLLHKYYYPDEIHKPSIELKQNLLDFYNLDKQLLENLKFKINKRDIKKILQEYDKDFGIENIENEEIPFQYFINRASVWMATGSGKTLVIIKLIAILAQLMQFNKIPNKKILFLTSREDLLEQFKTQVEKEFNKSSEYKLELHDLRNFDNQRQFVLLKSDKVVDVFYYRSDLIHDETSANKIDFRDIDNNGDWYIILDEAHKGETEESKRKIYYSILARNGFLFNFSATFTDLIDLVTCVYNFNLEKFVKAGYGKDVYLAQMNLEGLTEDDFSQEEKRIILLKVLILFTLLKQSKKKLQDYYHHPLMLVLVNSVNTPDADLEIFFKEIEKIASQNIDHNLLEKARQELISQIQGATLFSRTNIQLDKLETYNITPQNLLKSIFNSDTPGKIEILKIPQNQKELILKLQTTDKPFALIKVGDNNVWIKDKLQGYQLIEKFENESIFKNINNNNDINILMGSRTFYEGWDSNRPNIILYINIGQGSESRKFVLQSIGRGVRIEPIPNKRERFDPSSFNELSPEQKKYLNDNKNYVNLLETLFVFGTKVHNLNEIINAIKEIESDEETLKDLFKISYKAQQRPVLIPFYQKSDQTLIEKLFLSKYPINQQDYEMLREYLSIMSDQILILKHNIDLRVLREIRKHIDIAYYDTDSEKSIFVIKKEEVYRIGNIDFIIKNVFDHFSTRLQEFKQFKEVEKEIIHFKEIKVNKEKAQQIKDLIKKVQEYPKIKYQVQKLQHELRENKVNEEQFIQTIKSLQNQYPPELTYDNILIKYISAHYYIPLIIATDEKVTYLNHIIKTKSERLFLNNLIKYLEYNNEKNIFEEYDWWLFSKIDEQLDEVYIPYYDTKLYRISKFKPDFIFWLIKGNTYHIVFVDPKSTEFEDANRKIEGFKSTFTQPSYKYQDYTIKVHLRLLTDDKNKIQHSSYQNFWYELSNIKEIFKLHE